MTEHDNRLDHETTVVTQTPPKEQAIALSLRTFEEFT